MSVPVCSRLDDLLSRRDDDRLAPSEERLLVQHLAACQACAAEAIRHDPVLLFTRDAAPGSPDVLTDEARERFVRDVLAATAASRAQRRLGTRHTGAALRLAASLLLAASIVGVWIVRDRGAVDARGVTVPIASRSEGRTAPAEAPPAVEEVGGVGTAVYQFPSTTPGEATVVFVVDRNADI